MYVTKLPDLTSSWLPAEGDKQETHPASMALGDLMASRLVHSSSSPSPSPSPSMAAPTPPLPNHHHNHVTDDLPVANGPEPRNGLEVAEVEKPAPVVYLPQVVVLCEQRHERIDEAAAAAGPSTSGLVSKWRPKDRMKTGCVALVLCLNISVDPPDVIKISPCARMECWIDPFSMAPPKALENIGKTLHSQYERWQPKARYKLQLDPTVEEVKKLCNTCRRYARSERVLFHYNGHGVPKPTTNGEIWVFNKSYTQYIPLPITDLDSWLKTPSIYVFDCSAAGIIVKAFLERLDWSSSSSSSSQKDCILLAACEAHQTLPQSAEFPADVFTACLTTPIKMALHWFCKRSLLRGSMDHSLIDQIPGRQNDRKTLLGELNWIFTAITDTIAWNVLPHDLFQRLFRQDLLVASLFRNFLLAERIMRSANCSPISYPLLPPTHQHHMWDAWDMAAEICLSKLPQLIADPNAEFQQSPFFTEQLTAFEVWLDHGSEDKKPPEQLPIVLQVLLSQSHRFRALVLLGRFLDMGPWAVDLALSVGIFPYVLKLLQTSAMELRQILVFIWTKILSLDKSCQVDLVKDGGHAYFIRFLDSLDAYPDQRAMAAFVLAVIVDGHRTGQEACIHACLIDVCLRHLQPENPHDAQTEPLLLQWLCLCLGKLWEDFAEAQLLGLQSNAPEILIYLLSEPQPEVQCLHISSVLSFASFTIYLLNIWSCQVRASAVFALGNLLDMGSTSSNGADDDSDDDEKVKAEINVVRSLLQVSSDGSPLVRCEVAIALTRFALGHNKHLKSVAAEYWKPQTNSLLKSPPSLANISSPNNVYSPNNIRQGSSGLASHIGPVLRVGSDSSATGRDGRVSTSSPIAASSILHGSPQSDDSSQHSDSGILLRDNASNGGLSYTRSRPADSVVYSQYISTMCSVAKDPYPRIATIGRRALSLIGVKQVVMKNSRFNSGGAHQGETSAPPSNFGMARSSSWFDMNSGNFSITFRTPPVSPPQHDYLTGLRRVCSMEFKPHPMNSPEGLADPLLSSAAAPSNADLSILPKSTIYNWSCGYFSRPLLTGSDDNEEAHARREERGQITLDCIAKCQRSSCKMTSQIASWDTRFDSGTKAALLLPFSPIVIAADENEQIRVWNYDDALPVNSFQNHKLSDRGLSKLLLINELDESLLLAASSDGNVRIWKNFTQKGGQKLVTAFSSVQGHRAAGRSIVIDWQQQSGCLYASGDMSSILVWDLDKEQLLSTIQSSGDSAISALSASQVRSGHFAAGFADGSVRIFDVRSPDRLIYMARPHAPRTEKVVGIGFQPGFDPYKIVSASQAGDIQFLDVRRAAEPYLTIEAHRGSLTALAVHRHAPVVASGSAKQMIKVFSLEGEQLTIIRYQPSFMGQRIGSVNCLSFHPYKSLLAAGAGDNALVSIYAEENYK
ncbi:regulatory-associated protein of TOR 1-like isoform X2 [Panicum virgatum]|uniref:regulatory-associated protein of TOR 1-like isoform X2 n=1 Tax=Panicum virgatum TaxID=38727 RepID=UPI0019D62854|nr:regulatory-associated protein of TOR 1-like isoform X2 [Panicum virgatum]